MKIKFNNKGMTLIEVMVAASIMAIIGVVFTQTQMSQVKEQKRQQAKIEVQSFHNYVRFLIVNSAPETVNQ